MGAMGKCPVVLVILATGKTIFLMKFVGKFLCKSLSTLNKPTHKRSFDHLLHYLA